MTNYYVEFSESSENDLEEIILFIAQDNITRAITFTDEVMAFIKSQLSIFPFSGTKQEDGGFMIIYKKESSFTMT
jgi:plasmid stabilization system protein ParE